MLPCLVFLVIETLKLKRLAVRLERAAELKQSAECLGKFGKEKVVISSILLHPLLKLLVLHQRVVGGQHHQRLGLFVLVLLGAVPLTNVPLLVEEQLEKVIGKVGGGEGPGAIIARVLGVAAAETVSTNQGNHLAVVEAHAAKDVANVGRTLGSIGQTTLDNSLGLGGRRLCQSAT